MTAISPPSPLPDNGADAAPGTRWSSLSASGLRWVLATLAALVLLAGGFALVMAQVSGDRGIAPTASNADIEVDGIEVDVTAESGEEARLQAWEEAPQKAWEKIDGPAISDSQLSRMVSAIVIEQERIGPNRYVATLGVTFDRQRAGQYLGRGEVERSSAPMLVLPVTISAGAYTVFEVRNPWQRAWARFNPGASRIDYVRPSGAGGDSLLLTYGQAGRRSRNWWRATLDQYGAADVLVPMARIDHQFPGGPITGSFIARYGPDSSVLASFEMTAQGPDELAPMLDDAVKRMDEIFGQALVDGKLQPDPTLRAGGSGEVDPAIARLIQIGRAIRARDRALEERRSAAASAPTSEATSQFAESEQTSATGNFVVQFATPDAAAFDAALSGVRQAGGVRGLAVTSTAIGSVSVMRVSYAGDMSSLAAALRAQGFSVREGADALSISR